MKVSHVYDFTFITYILKLLWCPIFFINVRIFYVKYWIVEDNFTSRRFCSVNGGFKFGKQWKCCCDWLVIAMLRQYWLHCSVSALSVGLEVASPDGSILFRPRVTCTNNIAAMCTAGTIRGQSSEMPDGSWATEEYWIAKRCFLLLPIDQRSKRSSVVL